ncbi:Co2+/Mg2+ efflux protein ApaG [bacterium]|nr:Co2+/Mg2+ efflux protein ApaG [bacterium]
MVRSVTKQIEIIVKSAFHEEASSPDADNYVFSYEISIVNKGEAAVQLISREWIIKDLPGTMKMVKGIGVVGEQPVIQPGAKHTYISGCNFAVGMGYMQGYYYFERVQDRKSFRVRIPRFAMVFPPILN